MSVEGCAEIPQAQSCLSIPTSSIPEKLADLAKEFEELQLENYSLRERIGFFRKAHLETQKEFIPKASGRSDQSPIRDIARHDVEDKVNWQQTQSLLYAQLYENNLAGLTVAGLAGTHGSGEYQTAHIEPPKSDAIVAVTPEKRRVSFDDVAVPDRRSFLLAVQNRRISCVDSDFPISPNGSDGSTHVVHEYLDDDTQQFDKRHSATRHSAISGVSMPSAHSASMASMKRIWSRAQASITPGEVVQSVFPRWYDPDPKNRDRNYDIRKGIRDSTNGVGEFSAEDEAGANGIEHEKKPSWGSAISPVSRQRVCWDMCAVVMLLYEIWVTPFRFFFLAETATPPSLLVLGHICTFFWSMDIILNFFTGYVHKDQLVIECRRCAKNYLYSWFFIDLIATIPYDLFIAAAASSEWSSTIRVTKVAKVMKTLRFLKMVRALQIIYRMGQAERHNAFLSQCKVIVKPTQVLMLLCTLAHTNGCLYSTQLLKQTEDDLDSALEMYMHCFWWAYTGLATGSIGVGSGADTVGRWLFDMVLATQRIALIAVGFVWVACITGNWVAETTHWNAQKRATTTYLQRHKVTTGTQVQVLYSLRETSKAKQLQKHFHELMSQQLSLSLRRTICQELWTTRLLSLGLLHHIADWHEDLIPELTLLVIEEVLAAKTMLFREGEVSAHAYCIFEGKLVVRSSLDQTSDVTFYKDMWVGEKALVNPQLRRSGTVIAKATTTLLCVPGEGFHGLLARYGLIEHYHNFVSTELWRGLCGRCGVLGDHFSHQCPMMRQGAGTQDPGNGTWIMKSYSKLERAMTNQFTSASSTSANFLTLGNDLKNFLRAQRLSWLTPFLQDLNVTTLEKLADLDLALLQSEVSAQGHCLTSEDQLAISTPVIRKFILALQDQAQSVLVTSTNREDHFLFLSHYKREAGTEASLMRSELERILQDDQHPAATKFNTPIFLDSEDLQNLQDLQQRVKDSHNLVLLLTANVLTRPWVLVEVVTAIREGVQVVPVILHKGFDDFELPDEDWYERMKSGKLLDSSGLKVLSECGIKAEDVCNVLRTVFQRIAVTYSPHRTEKIRRAELQALLKQCRTKRKGVGATSRRDRVEWRQDEEAFLRSQ